MTLSPLAPQPPPFQPYRWATADFQLGLRPISPRQWVLMDGQFASHMREKRRLLAAHTQKYYRAIPASLPAQRELRERVVAHLVDDHPEGFSLRGSTITSRIDGHQCNLLDDSVEPLLQLSSLIEEDFILLEERGDGPCITAAANVYSSSGRIISSVASNVESAHNLVPKLNEKLAPRINRVLGSVHPASPCERFNWQLTPLSTLFFPPDNPHQSNAEAMHGIAGQLQVNPQDVGKLLWIRVERQTLCRLQDTKAVAFSLHTFTHPLDSIETDLSSLRSMLALLHAYSVERLRYTEMDLVFEPIVTWLESAADKLA